MSHQVSSNFERTIIEQIKKNLRHLVLDITKLEAILEKRQNENIDTYEFEKIRRKSLDCCRKILGNIEILPNPSDLKKRVNNSHV